MGRCRPAQIDLGIQLRKKEFSKYISQTNTIWKSREIPYTPHKGSNDIFSLKKEKKNASTHPFEIARYTFTTKTQVLSCYTEIISRNIRLQLRRAQHSRLLVNEYADICDPGVPLHSTSTAPAQPACTNFAASRRGRAGRRGGRNEQHRTWRCASAFTVNITNNPSICAPRAAQGN